MAVKKKRAPRRPGSAKPGPKPYEASSEDRERVEVLLGGGMSEEEIAVVFGMARNTLRKHFGRELMTGRAKRRSEMLMAMFQSGKAGNVSAQKAYMAAGQIHAAADELEREISKPARPAKIGKKAAAAEEAKTLTAGGDAEWGDDLKVPNAVH